MSIVLWNVNSMSIFVYNLLVIFESPEADPVGIPVAWLL